MADGTIMSGIFKRLVVALIWWTDGDESSYLKTTRAVQDSNK